MEAKGHHHDEAAHATGVEMTGPTPRELYSHLRIPVYIWRLWCQKRVSKARRSNYTPQFTVGCNYFSTSEIPASCAKVLISQARISNYTPQFTVGCNYFPMPEIPASSTKVLILFIDNKMSMWRGVHRPLRLYKRCYSAFYMLYLCQFHTQNKPCPNSIVIGVTSVIKKKYITFTTRNRNPLLSLW